ncbi:COX15/CtaA family protein [Halostella salina]|uniref:COX15/CtaA family protein n=1 Tax=Halostella salina TaxID=1547897 RepID=UPI000EF84025|nr:COX15/CtaA family protein [Halostella salina]
MTSDPSGADGDAAGTIGDERFRGLAVATAITTLLLILIGLYTAVAGFGLTCETRWPLCDGAVFGLFPANWGSFVEWFHRLVAMVTGFMILGLTGLAWRGGRQRRVRYATALATLVLPSQIVLGALTVTEYELLILAAHFTTALLIFLPLIAVAAWAVDGGSADATGRLGWYAGLPPVLLALGIAAAAWTLPDGPAAERVGLIAGTALPLAVVSLAAGPAVRALDGRPRPSRARTATAGALVLLAAGIALTPGLIAASLSITIGYYAALLAALAGLFAAGLWAADADTDGSLRSVRLAAFGATGLLAVQLVVSRVLFSASTTTVLAAMNVVVLVVAVAVYRLSGRLVRGSTGGRAASGD